MSDKGKAGKKGKKSKEKDPNKLNNVDRQFCELTIADLQKKVSNMRAYIAKLEEENVSLQENMDEMDKDRTDITAHLERRLEERDDVINELQERLEEITKVRKNENKEMKERFMDQEAKYKAMHDQLQSEIKLLTGKLNSLDEFRQQRDVLLAKFEDLNQELKETQRQGKEKLFEVEQRVIVEKDQLKKQVESKLVEVSEDFMRSSDIRTSAYTRRLVRENYALQKEIDSLITAQVRMTQDFENYKFRNKENVEDYRCLQHTNESLLRTMRNQVKVIEKLTARCEQFKVQVIENAKYKKKYTELIKVGACDRFENEAALKKVRTLNSQIDKVNMEKKQLINSHKTQELEIGRLSGILQEIEQVIEFAIGVRLNEPFKSSDTSTEEYKYTASMRDLARKDLISELKNIMSRGADPRKRSIDTTAEPIDAYRLGDLGLVKQYTKPSLMDVFVKHDRTNEGPDKDFIAKQTPLSKPPDSRQQRCKNQIYDIELGPFYYVSSSREEVADVPQADDEEMGEEEGGGTSSDDYKQARSDSSQASVASGHPSKKFETESQQPESSSSGSKNWPMRSTSDTLAAATTGAGIATQSTGERYDTVDDEDFASLFFY